jgi:hypothetical protein
VEEAWAKGREMKARKRTEGATGVGFEKRAKEGEEMARNVVDWVGNWWNGSSASEIEVSER